MNNEFQATNEFEKSLIDIKSGKLSLPDFIRIFLENELIIPSAIEAQENGSIVPLFFNKEKQSMLSVFTSVSLLKLYESNIKHYLIMSGKKVLIQLPPDNGLVINPGHSMGFDISVDGIKNIINDFLEK